MQSVRQPNVAASFVFPWQQVPVCIVDIICYDKLKNLGVREFQMMRLPIQRDFSFAWLSRGSLLCNFMMKGLVRDPAFDG